MRRIALMSTASGVLIASLMGPAGCSAPQRVTVFEDSLSLPDKRFVGPVHIEVPRRSDHNEHDFEVRVALIARCAPRLVVRFPDGETRKVGVRDARWQELLTARAEAVPTEPSSPDNRAGNGPAGTELAVTEPAGTEPAGTEPAGSSVSQAPGGGEVGGGVSAGTTTETSVETGQWVERKVASWPGQLKFEQLRERHCARVTTHTKTYVTGYDELGKVSVWAEVPQEMVDARIDVTVVELVPRSSKDDENDGRRLAKRGQAQPQTVPDQPPRAASRRPRPRKVSKPNKPKPPPKREKPRPAKVEGATWSPGHWAWSGTRGRWQWVSGYWQPPRTMPALKAENHGSPPVAGCTWKRGHWVWVRGNGSWKWTSGYWNPPPPKVEKRGKPAGPGAPWYKGSWQRRGNTFVWQRGRWGRPANKREAKPPKPNPGARWSPGSWQPIGDTYKWIAGRWIGSGGGRPAPPPRKRESKPPSPATGAVWLAGYWRYDEARSKYKWVPGHYEIPPGKNYVWVPGRRLPSGQVIGGRWVIRVEASP